MTATWNDNRRYVMKKARELATQRRRGGPAAVARQDVLALPLMDIVDMVLELLPLVDPARMVVAKAVDVLPCQVCGGAMETAAPNKRYCSRPCKDAALRERRAES